MNVVVLGASSGLGAALALQHAGRGDAVLALARREDRLSALAAIVRFSSPQAGKWSSLRADLTEPNDLERVAATIAGGDGVERLYVNAAANPPVIGGSVGNRLDAIERYHRLLFVAPVAFVSWLIARGAVTPTTTVVVISSLAAALPFEGMELYCAGKAALEAWVRTMQGARTSPRIVIVRPGRFESEFFGARPFEVDALPHGKARRIVRAVDEGRTRVEAGGIGDLLGGRLASLLGRHARVFIRDGRPAART